MFIEIDRINIIVTGIEEGCSRFKVLSFQENCKTIKRQKSQNR